jgi:hypothetical protein
MSEAVALPPPITIAALVYQDQMRIEFSNRVDIGWDLTTLTRLDDVLMFPALLFEMTLPEVYGGVALG